MATGEKKWSTKGKQAKKMSFEPFPAGTYGLKLRGGTVDIKRGAKPESLPYVNAQMEALGTAQQEGGKNRVLFVRFFTSLKPSDKDGVVMPERSGQILEYAKALGEEASFNVVNVSAGELGSVPCLSAQEIKAWLQAHDGQTVQGKVKVRKGTKEYPNDQNELDYFVEAEPASEDEEDEEEPDEDEDEKDDAAEDIEAAGDDDDDEGSDEDEEDDDDDEPTPAPKPAKKSAPPPPPPAPAKKKSKK